MSTYDFDAARYAKASKHQKEWGNKIIAELDLDGSESVLDLGCGDGVLTEQLAKRVPEGKVVGIDSSARMIEAAGKRARKNLAFELMDINEIRYEGEFDLVFSNATLHWIKDHKHLLSSVYKCLKPGGAVRFNFAGHGNCSHFNRIVQEVMAEPSFSRYFDRFEWPWYMPSVGAYDALVRASGLQDIRVWGENADRYFSDTDEMTRWIDQPSLVPFLKCVDAKDRKRFRDEVVARMISVTVQEDGTCFETFRRVNLLARRP